MENIIYRHIKKNIGLYSVYFFIAAICIIAGYLLYSYSADASKLNIFTKFSLLTKDFISQKDSFNNAAYFKNNLLGSLKYVLYIWLSAFFCVGHFTAGAMIAVKSFSLGYCVAVFSSNLTENALVTIVLLLILGNMIKLVTYSFCGVCSLRYKNINLTKDTNPNLILIYTIFMLLACVVLLLTSLYESYILPYFVFNSLGKILFIE